MSSYEIKPRIFCINKCCAVQFSQAEKYCWRQGFTFDLFNQKELIQNDQNILINLNLFLNVWYNKYFQKNYPHLYFQKMALKIVYIFHCIIHEINIRWKRQKSCNKQLINVCLNNKPQTLLNYFKCEHFCIFPK